MTKTLPAPVAAYFAAETPEAIADCFVENGIAVDEKHTHRGRDEIRRWREGVAKIRYTHEILSVERDGDRVDVATRIAGDFPGSPVELGNTFTLDGDRIARLEIA